MQILFVDESSTPPPPQKALEKPYFVLGGLVIPEDIWAKLRRDLNTLKNQFNLNGEIKWRYFAPARQGSRSHTLSHLDVAQKEKLRTELYGAISRYKSVRIISVVVNTPLQYRRSQAFTADDLYCSAYKVLTERFQYYLQDLERIVGQSVKGIVVCDNRGPNEDRRLRAMHHELMTGSGPFSKYDNIIEGLFIAPSDLSVGIQYADMVAGAIYRYFSANDDRFFSQIKNSFRRSPQGKLEGFGLAKLPALDW